VELIGQINNHTITSNADDRLMTQNTRGALYTDPEGVLHTVVREIVTHNIGGFDRVESRENTSMHLVYNFFII
jgi:hypothetical protein